MKRISIYIFLLWSIQALNANEIDEFVQKHKQLNGRIRGVLAANGKVAEEDNFAEVVYQPHGVKLQGHDADKLNSKLGAQNPRKLRLANPQEQKNPSAIGQQSSPRLKLRDGQTRRQKGRMLKNPAGNNIQQGGSAMSDNKQQRQGSEDDTVAQMPRTPRERKILPGRSLGQPANVPAAGARNQQIGNAPGAPNQPIGNVPGAPDQPGLGGRQSPENKQNQLVGRPQRGRPVTDNNRQAAQNQAGSSNRNQAGQDAGYNPNQGQNVRRVQTPGQGQAAGQTPGQGQGAGQTPGQGQNVRRVQTPGQGQTAGQTPGQGQGAGQLPKPVRNVNQRENQGQNAGQTPNQGQTPGQNVAQRPNQGQTPGHNVAQRPNQGQNSAQRPNQGQNSAQRPNQGQNSADRNQNNPASNPSGRNQRPNAGGSQNPAKVPNSGSRAQKPGQVPNIGRPQKPKKGKGSKIGSGKKSSKDASVVLPPEVDDSKGMASWMVVVIIFLSVIFCERLYTACKKVQKGKKKRYTAVPTTHQLGEDIDEQDELLEVQVIRP
eukprot:348761_1